MELGSIPPPIGLNILLIRNIAPDISLKDVIYGTLPFVILMIFAMMLLCVLPSISTPWPDMAMRRVTNR